MAKTFKVGDQVRLTGKHLRATGQFAGPAGHSVWTVIGFDGSFLITDEEKTSEEIRQYFNSEELKKDPSLRFRRIHSANVELAPVRGRKPPGPITWAD